MIWYPSLKPSRNALQTESCGWFSNAFLLERWGQSDLLNSNAKHGYCNSLICWNTLPNVLKQINWRSFLELFCRCSWDRDGYLTCFAGKTPFPVAREPPRTLPHHCRQPKCQRDPHPTNWTCLNPSQHLGSVMVLKTRLRCSSTQVQILEGKEAKECRTGWTGNRSSGHAMNKTRSKFSADLRHTTRHPEASLRAVWVGIAVA